MTVMAGGVEREISKAVGVRVVRSRAWEREAKCPIEAMLNDIRVRRG